MAASALLVLAALAGCAAVAAAEVREVAHFTGIHAADGIVVHVNTSADGSSSVTLDSTPEALSKVKSEVDRWGTLILTKSAGAGPAKVVAEVTVPGALTYAGAASGSSILARAVAGTMVVSDHSSIVAEALESSGAVSVTASSTSSVQVSRGSVPGLTVSSSSGSSASFGGLSAATASLTVSSKSSISDLTVGSATATAASSSSLTFTATGHVGLSCTSSEVRISGTGTVTTWSDWACTVVTPSAQGSGAGTQAAVPVYP